MDGAADHYPPFCLCNFDRSYVVPLPWQHELQLFGAYQKSDPGADAAGFDLSAESSQYGLRYEIPLASRSGLTTGFLHSVVIGYDGKESNSDIFFGGANVSDTDTRISQGRLGYRFDLPDRWGRSSGSVDLVGSPGSGSQDEKFAQQRALAASDYVYANASLSRLTQLPASLQWHLRLKAQWADGNLLPSEQLGLGGYQSVRGYEEYAQIGDRGAIVNNELHYLLPPAGPLPDPLDTFLFFDWGRVSNVDRLPGESDAYELASWGAGLNFSFRRYVRLSLAYGRQLQVPSGETDKGERLHASIIFAF